MRRRFAELRKLQQERKPSKSKGSRQTETRLCNWQKAAPRPPSPSKEHAQDGRGINRAAPAIGVFLSCLAARVPVLCAGYNRSVLRLSAALLATAAVLTSCGNSIRNKDKVQQAIVNRLQTRSGLDLNSLDVTTTAVSFDKNMAYATVAFHPKGDPNVNSGMVMKYTLEARDGKWVVVNVADSQGHGMSGHPSAGGDQLPPGRPPIDSGNPHASSQGQAASGRTQ